MANQHIAHTTSANVFPLLIKSLLESGVIRAPEQEIVSANQNRFTYREFAERVERLASGLASLGIERGDTVAIMDWDTHRYLECFFAVPMMGAVLHTVNGGRRPTVRFLFSAHGEHQTKCVELLNTHSV